ncbi:hypothetical protein CYD94_06190 [Ralstonia solanacearum]|nr:hypothetical protein BC350_02260 [Ralstonia pseudosolanacearum]AUS41838.1 hypothetical protein CYD94_06190 [Ralstonia solanacearum]AXV68817.1 hypothetical protein CJO74_05655 [Ralstonia solanacearum]AXV96543.1 hypothetical protein CJO80_13825 [Ralstonia solanacearum]AXW01758.1 hypothetical protein CJO81_13910 [Ralstonia solanacearum]
MTSPIRGAVGNYPYLYSQEQSPTTSPTSSPSRSAPRRTPGEFSGLTRPPSLPRNPGGHFRAGSFHSVRFSDESDETHVLEREDRKPGIVQLEDTASSYRAGELYAQYPKGKLPRSEKDSISRHTYEAYKDLVKNKGYKS